MLIIDDENEPFRVVSNSMGQYSIWPQSLDLPSGWVECVVGSREYCLDEIDRLWKNVSPTYKTPD